MTKTNILDHTGSAESKHKTEILGLLLDFATVSDPLERLHLCLLKDMRTGAAYVECHIRANKVNELGTVDVPLDPEEQAECEAGVRSAKPGSGLALTHRRCAKHGSQNMGSGLALTHPPA
jgi:hypothetical protein